MHFTGTIRGNLISSELRFTHDGKPIWNGRVAVNHKRKNRDTGSYEDSGTTWINITAFGYLAENAAETLNDKNIIEASGRMETREYTKKDGNQGSSLEMVADSLGAAVLPWPDKNKVSAPSAPSAPAQPAADPWGQQNTAADPWGGQPSNSSDWGTPNNGQPAF